jgi:hypothetical protein
METRKDNFFLGIQLVGMKRPLTNIILKVWGPHVADEFTQCVRLLELQVKQREGNNAD